MVGSIQDEVVGGPVADQVNDRSWLPVACYHDRRDYCPDHCLLGMHLDHHLGRHDLHDPDRPDPVLFLDADGVPEPVRAVLCLRVLPSSSISAFLSRLEAG